MDLIEAIENRHMIRSFTDEPVDREVIERLLHSAALAPSALNLQPWRFHVASGDTLEELTKALSMCTLSLVEYYSITDAVKITGYEEFYANLGGAPVIMAISLPLPVDELETINFYVSAGCALENVLLTAVSEGLGCCNITASFWVRERLAEILELDEGRAIVCIVLLGHPAAPPFAPTHSMDIATFHD